jgi:hypothetical protein
VYNFHLTDEQLDTLRKQRNLTVEEILEKIPHVSPQIKPISIPDAEKHYIPKFKWVNENLAATVATSTVAVLSTPVVLKDSINTGENG